MRGVPVLFGLLAVAMVLPLVAPSGQALATRQPGEPPVAWVVEDPSTAPAVSLENSMFIVARDDANGPVSLRAYDRTHALLWKKDLSGSLHSAPGYGGVRYTDAGGVVHDSRRILVRDGTGMLRAYWESDGSLAWSQNVGLPSGELGAAAPMYFGDRFVLWVPAADGDVKVRAVDQATGAMLWESSLAWDPAAVRPQLGANGWGVYVASRLADGAMWQFGVDGMLRRSWSAGNYFTSSVRWESGGTDYLYVALADPSDSGGDTQWRVEKRSADTGAALWQANFGESSTAAPCCTHIAPPFAQGGRVFVATQGALFRLAIDDGRILGSTYSEGPVWSNFPHLFNIPMLVRGPWAGKPARLESFSELGERSYTIPLDLTAMPLGGAFIAMFGGSLTVVQGLPERLLDAVPAGSTTVFGYPVQYRTTPTWDVPAGTSSLTYDSATQRLDWAPVKSYNPMYVDIQRQAADGAWVYAGRVMDADYGDGSRSFQVTSSGNYKVVAEEFDGTYSLASNSVSVTMSGSSSTTMSTSSSSTTSTPAPSGYCSPSGAGFGTSGCQSGPQTSSSPQPSCSPSGYDAQTNACNDGGGAGGGGGGSPSGSGSSQTGASTYTYTEAPGPPPSFSATATYTGSASGPTFDSKAGRLVLDTPEQGASLSGQAVLRGRMVDQDLLGTDITLLGLATWGKESWPFGQAVVAADGTWEMTWDTKASPDGSHLLPDGGYRIAIEGAGSSIEAAYTLANGHWLRTNAANVTFEGADDGPVWVNATWSGTSGFDPTLAWVVVTGSDIPVRQPVTITRSPSGEAGVYQVTFASSLQVVPLEHVPLDVHLEVETAQGGVVAHELARRPEPGTVVTSRASGSVAWAAPAAAAGLAATGLAAAVVASTEAGRFWFMRLAPFALFSRIRGDEAKVHRRREQLLLLVETRPGITFSELGKESGVRGGVLTHHVTTLEREGLVRRQRVGARLHFHPAGVPAVPVRQLPALQANLLRLVHASPRISQSEAARRMGVTRQALHYHVVNLRNAGLLTLEPAGRETLLAVAPEAGQRLWSCPSCRTLMDGAPGPTAACPSCGARPGASVAAS